MDWISIAIALLSLMTWLVLLSFWGDFWRSDQQISPDLLQKYFLADYPAVRAIIPARNEADVLPRSLPSLLSQDYPGDFELILIDDQSQDGTAEVAKNLAENLGQSHRLTVITGKPLIPGWSGKLWAMEQGIRYVQQQSSQPEYFWLTDADIEHHATNLKELVTQSRTNDLVMASLMVKLRCESVWERFLIPSFVFFFQKLYPFAWVNDPGKKMAAAAGGCILLRREALDRMGGVDAIRETLIDDCSLAAKVKCPSLDQKIDKNYNIWLGLTEKTHSLRPYDSLSVIWEMVARTAFTQLGYSPLLLLGTLVAMFLMYWVAPLFAIAGILLDRPLIALLGGMTWLLMAIAYFPTVKFYRQSPLWTLTLPIIALLYSLMTVDSALRHWQGKGGGWKGRIYPLSSKT